MFYLAMAVAVSVLVIPNKSLGAIGASNPPATFQASDCELYLSGPGGRELVARAEEWLMGLPAKRYMTPRRVEIKEGEPVDPEILNPKVVWFTSGPDDSYETVRERFESAREKADQFLLHQVRTMQSDAPDESERAVEPLSTIEKAALGISSSGPVYLNEVRIRIIPPRPQVLRLNVQVEGRKAADLALPLSSLRPGFRDNIALWLASQLKTDEVPTMLPPGDMSDQNETIRNFLDENGRFGLFRKANGRTFAYVFSMQSLAGGPRELDGFTLDIYSAMPCLHRQMLKGELVFPLMRANQTYLCLSDTYIKLQVPFQTAPDIERPAGWTDRQFQL